MYKVEETMLDGCLKITPNVFVDHRGVSIKPFHKNRFDEIGIKSDFREDLAVVSHKNVLRGLHFQKEPYEQEKLIYCIQGSILDVVLDIRKNSNTYGKYLKFNLNSSNKHMLYIPTGFAHGYLSLEENSIVMYKMSNVYNPKFENGIRWNSVGIDWGIESPIISERDTDFMLFDEFDTEFI